MSTSPPTSGLAASPPSPPTDVARRARWVFLASVLVTAALYIVPYGHTIGWPLVLVSTLAHELGHGLTALVLGARFESLQIWPDASGAALWSGRVGRFAQATIAAGGLVGPAFAALALLILGRRPRLARIGLGTLGGALLLLDVVRVRNLFGFVFVAILGTVLLGLALKASAGLAQAVVVFLAVELALSVYSRSDYLFTRWAETASGRMPSDVAVMSQALWLPYWLWGLLCGALSLVALLAGMRYFLAGEPGGRLTTGSMPSLPRLS